MNLADLVREAARRSPDKPALLYRDAAMTWAELERHVATTAAGLAALGLAPGDRVAIALGNTPGFVVSYFGALRGGFVAVPVNTAYTPAELVHVLGDSGAVAVVATRSAAPVLLGLRDEVATLRHVIVSDAAAAPEGTTSLDAVGAAGADGKTESERGDEDLAVLIYTSGTSGRPKGAMLTHRALLANLDQCSAITPPVVQEDDVVLLVLPLFHIYGLNPGLGMVAKTGATGLLVERFDPVDTLAEIHRRHVTNVVGAPPMYVAWSMLPDLSEAFASVRLLVSGAAPLPANALSSILDRTGQHVFEGYGLTETSPVLTTTLMSEVAKPASIGKPVPGVEVKLVDEAGDEVDEDDPGEVVVRGPNLFSGYWPDGHGGPDAQGWWATGDVAFADRDGDLFLVDRRKELILVSGFNVYPREVEDVLLGHPDVEEAAVIGIPHPYTGEAVKALVVVRAGAQLSADDVVAHCATSLARFKCPTAVEFVDELPHSATGKVSKGRLRENAGLLARAHPRRRSLCSRRRGDPGMRSQAVLPLVATVVAWEFALALFRRWRRSRRPYLRSWALSLLFFAAGSACLWYGTAFGWSEPVFRGYYICGALLSVPWLAMGELELLARPNVARVVLAFLVLFSIDAAITVGASPLVDGRTVSGFAAPHGSDYFGALPRVLVVVSNAVGTLVVVGGTLWSGWRARGRPEARGRFRGTLVIALGVLVAAAGGALTFLSEEDSQAATLAAGVTVMYAGFVLASRRPGAHRARAQGQAEPVEALQRQPS